jgi:hypothetical protein
MTPRRLLPVLLCICLLTSAPALAIGFAVDAGSGATGTSVGGGGNTNAEWSSPMATPNAAFASDCATSLRGFRVRNTLRPSERKRELARCRQDARADDLAARASGP